MNSLIKICSNVNLYTNIEGRDAHLTFERLTLDSVTNLRLNGKQGLNRVGVGDGDRDYVLHRRVF